MLEIQWTTLAQETTLWSKVRHILEKLKCDKHGVTKEGQMKKKLTSKPLKLCLEILHLGEK